MLQHSHEFFTGNAFFYKTLEQRQRAEEIYCLGWMCPLLSLIMRYFINLIICVLIKISIPIQNTNMLQELLGIILDNSPIDLNRQHQIGEHQFGHLESLSGSEYAFKLSIFSLALDWFI